MTRFIALASALFLLSGCAALGLQSSAERQRTELWERAHTAYAAGEIAQALTLFQQIRAEHPETGIGHESLFYIGALHLDPRNPEWDPAPAQASLDAYLAADFGRYTEHHANWPEAQVLQRLALQLNMPPEERVPGLQPETRTVRVVVPARESRALRGEVEQLRTQLAERERELTEARAELERIRRTLSGKR